MAIKIDELRYILGLDSSGFFSSLRKAQAGADNTRKDVEKPINLKANVQSVVDGFARVGLALQGIQQIKNLILGPGQEFIRLSNDQEKAEAKLEAVIRSTGGAAGFTADQLKAYASELQSLTTFGDEQIIPFMAQLGTFTNITGQEFKRATALALDMSDIFGGDLKSAALQLGKALNDPVAGVSALSRVGVQFTDVQKEQIAIFQDQNDIIGAQTVILDELQRQFGGVAEALAQTDAGQLQQFENAVGDAKEVLGALLKDVLVPLTQILRPVVETFTGLTEGTRNAALATTTFLAVAIKAPAVFTAIRAAAIGLQASMGPAGWLLLGLGALVTAFSTYAASADDANESNVLLASSNDDLAKSLQDVEDSARKAANALGYEQALAKRGEILNFIKEQNAELQRINDEQQVNPFAVTDEDEAEARRKIADAQANLKAVNQRIIDLEIEKTTAQQREADKRKQLTEDELRAQDDLKAYEFQSNRISLADYIGYLESRTEAQRAALGADSVEFLKFVDTISALRQRLAQQSGQNVDSLDLQVRLPDQSALDQLTEFYGEYRNIQTEFEDLGYQDLISAYDTKQLLFDENLNYLRQKEGEQSEAYKAELKRREQMQANYNAARISLEQKAAVAVISLGAQLMSAFAGQSKTLFDIGKGLAIANATVSTYEAITRAYKDYPWPFNLAVAAIQAGLGFAQVANIAGTQFNPTAGGKATGGMVTDKDLAASPQTPPGEDGIIGIQRGEYVINRRSVQKYLPIIEAINTDSRKAIINTISKFATGGQITQADVLQLMLLPTNATGDDISNTTNNAGAAITNFITSYTQLTRQATENPELSITLPKFATGGKVTQADVLQSIFTPSGESGIIGVQTGEYIINRQATARFLPLLESINSGQDIRRIPAFAEGGIVESPQPAINATTPQGATPAAQDLNLNVIAGVIQDAVIEGFERSKLRITGNLTGDGKELQSVLDKYTALKSDL